MYLLSYCPAPADTEIWWHKEARGWTLPLRSQDSKQAPYCLPLHTHTYSSHTHTHTWTHTRRCIEKHTQSQRVLTIWPCFTGQINSASGAAPGEHTRSEHEHKRPLAPPRHMHACECTPQVYAHLKEHDTQTRVNTSVVVAAVEQRGINS